MVVYDLPLNEVVFDFYDRLKSISKGYASFDYTLEDYRVGNLVKMSILVNSEPGRRAGHAGPRRPRRGPRPRHGREDEGADQPAHVPDPDPGGDRRQDHRPRDGPRAAQGRDRQVLRRRRQPQAQAPRQAEGRARSACASSAMSTSRRKPSSRR
jgi:GTP-binding protein LepA